MFRTLSLTCALAACTASNLGPAQPDLAPPPTPDLALTPDLAQTDSGPRPPDPPRGDPWTSAGGGSGASSSGRQLNFTVGGAAGRAEAANGAVITFGAFSTQTY